MNLIFKNIPYKKIPFEKVREEIKRMFPNSTIEKWDLIPNDIGRLAYSAGIIFSWKEVDWWNAFEYGNKEFGVKKFLSILFPGPIPGNSEVIIVTDECFADKSAYQLRYENLEIFCDTVYPKIHQMEFFQPLDFIFLFVQHKLLIVLHHEGLVTHFKI